MTVPTVDVPKITPEQLALYATSAGSFSSSSSSMAAEAAEAAEATTPEPKAAEPKAAEAAEAAEAKADEAAAGVPPADETDPNYFPPSTPVADMTAAQQAAFYRYHWHVEKAAREKATKAKTEAEEAARLAGLTDAEQKIEEARRAGAEQARKEIGDELVEYMFRANIGKLSEAELDEILAGVNKAAFMTDDGRPDQDKIKRYLAPFRTSGGGSAPAGVTPSSNDVDKIMEELQKRQGL